MGNGGCGAMVEIVSKGGYTIAGSEKAAAVRGMPEAAICAVPRRRCVTFMRKTEESIHAATRRKEIDGK